MFSFSTGAFVLASTFAGVVFISGNSVNKIETYTFRVQTACNLQNRIAGRCAHLMPGGYSYLQCCVACRANRTCIGVSKSAGNKCYIHTNCSSSVVVSCTSGSDTFHLHRKSPCFNIGTWNGSSCQCSGGWVGQWCERYAKSCAELAVYGYSKGTEHDVTLQLNDKLYPFRGKCNIFENSQNTYIMKTWGLLNANCRTWEDYVYGFYVDNFNFWIGLENMKALNDAGHTTVRLDVGYPLESWNYINFTMGDASQGYSFTYLSEFKYGNATSYKSCLSSVKGARFSTLDRDQDLDPDKNCATIAEAGWWFKTCNPSCIPMGSIDGRRMDGVGNMSIKYYEIVFYFEG